MKGEFQLETGRLKVDEIAIFESESSKELCFEIARLHSRLIDLEGKICAVVVEAVYITLMEKRDAGCITAAEDELLSATGAAWALGAIYLIVKG